MRVEVSTVLDCPLNRVWQEVQTSRLLTYVAAPLLKFEPIAPSSLPAVWSEGEYLVRMRFLGVLPLGKQWIVISHPPPAQGASSEPASHTIVDAGHGDLVNQWHHRITMTAHAGGRTHYTDSVDIDAGWLTPAIWLYAAVFYRHRQRRWRGLVSRNFDYGS